MGTYEWKPFTLLVSAEEVEKEVLKIEAGKYYKTRDGRKVGPISRVRGGEGDYYWSDGKSLFGQFTHNWSREGYSSSYHGLDIIAEWKNEAPSPSPIRTVTSREIVPGVYGRFEVTGTYMKNRVTLDFAPSSVGTSVPIFGMNTEELRESAHLFNQLAEALEDNGE